jgi:hypothetical protein
MIQASPIHSHTKETTMSKIATQYDITSCKSAEDILSTCELNWEPEVRTAAFMGDNNSFGAPASNFRAIVHPLTGKAFAFTGERFRPNSHVKVINDMCGLMQTGSVTPHGVSVWDGGGKIAIQYRCPDLDVTVGARSVVSPLLTLVVNHDSAGSDRSFFADFDFWCRNQAGMVAKIAGEGVRHSGQVVQRYEDLVEQRIISLRGGMGERYTTMRKMADSPRQLRGKDLLTYFARAMDFTPDSVRDAVAQAHQGEVLSAEGKVLKALVEDWRGDDHGVPGTVWHAYSAVTRYTTHTEGRNAATRSLRALTGAQERYVRAFQEAGKLVSA